MFFSILVCSRNPVSLRLASCYSTWAPVPCVLWCQVQQRRSRAWYHVEQAWEQACHVMAVQPGGWLGRGCSQVQHLAEVTLGQLEAAAALVVVVGCSRTVDKRRVR